MRCTSILRFASRLGRIIEARFLLELEPSRKRRQAGADSAFLDKGPIAGIVDDDVVVREIFGDLPAEFLFPQERLALANASRARLLEATTVRACARSALEAVGLARGVMIPTSGVGPTWPTGINGSLTHKRSYRAAAICSSRRRIGIDAEAAGYIPVGTLRYIATSSELNRAEKCFPSLPAGSPGALILSIKEAVFKAQVDTMRHFTPEHIRVTLDSVDEGPAAGGTFEAQIDGAAQATRGRWTMARQLIFTVAYGLPEVARRSPS